MKSSKLFVSSMLACAIALTGCAAEPEELQDRAGRGGGEGAAKSDEPVGEAAAAAEIYGTGWSPYGTITNAFAARSPAVAAFDNQLHMSHLDPASGGLYWSWFDGAAWAEPVALSAYRTTMSPAIAAHEDSLHLAYVDAATNNIFVAPFRGGQWGAAEDTRLYGHLEPAMAYYNEALHLFNVDPATSEIVFSTHAGGAWGPFVGTGLHSQSIPAVAVHGGRIHLLHQGQYSSRLAWSTYDGVAFVAETGFLPNRLAHGTPVLGVYGEHLHFMYRSLTGHQLLWGAWDGSSWHDFGMIPEVYGPQGTPGLVTVEESFFLVSPHGEDKPIGFFQYGGPALL